MISPADQKIIQIDVTNACPHVCANCTRFVGHHKQPFMMGLDTFKQAVKSLQGYKGMVGVMGGEPTLHPKFPEIVKILMAERPNDEVPKGRFAPIPNFVEYRNKELSDIRKTRGLWTSLGDGYAKHYEIIHDAFGYQCVNDHRHDGEHMALLMTRKELGYEDDEVWRKLRDNCWIQREWSASITPKGAFFCEVAGALDMLFGGPGGWPVVPGWWRREPKDFGDQLKWCEICSACLPVPRAKASAKKDIVSPDMWMRLMEIGSPKMKKGLVEILDLDKYSPEKYEVNQSCEPYLPQAGNAARVSDMNDSIKPKKITAVIVCVGYDDYLAHTLWNTVMEVDEVIVVTDEDDFRTQLLCEKEGVKCVVSKRVHENGAKFAKGKAVNDGLAAIKDPDWVLVMDADILLQKGFHARIKNMTLNPGALYYTRRWGPKDAANIQLFMQAWERNDCDFRKLFTDFAYKEIASKTQRRANAIEAFPYGYFQLFNVRAAALQGRDPIYFENEGTAEWDDSNFGMTVYPKDHQVQLPEWDFDVCHLPHGVMRQNWCGRVTERLENIEQYADIVPDLGYVCVTPCFWKGRMWKVGEKITSNDCAIPRHFQEVRA